MTINTHMTRRLIPLMIMAIALVTLACRSEDPTTQPTVSPETRHEPQSCLDIARELGEEGWGPGIKSVSALRETEAGDGTLVCVGTAQTGEGQREISVTVSGSGNGVPGILQDRTERRRCRMANGRTNTARDPDTGTGGGRTTHPDTGAGA